MYFPKEDELVGAFTIDGFGKTYQIGRTITYELIRKKKLRAVKVGKRTLILRRDADVWSKSLPALVA